MPATSSPAAPADDIVNLKHRLTGAAVLVSLGVFVLPIILSGQHASQPNAGSGIAHSGDRPPRGGAHNPQSDAGSAVAQGPAEGMMSGAGPRPQSQLREFVSHIKPLVAVVEPATAPELNDTLVEPQAPGENTLRLQPLDEDQAQADGGVAHGWVVRIGSFAEEANARQIVTILQSKGIEPQTSEVQTDLGKVIRVWVGPFQERVTAARQRAHIEQATGEKGYLKSYP